MRVVMAFDVGGTNVRALVKRVASGALADFPGAREVLRRHGGSKSAVLGFVAEVAGLLGPDDVLAGAAIAFAGPVSEASARVVNWPSPNAVDMADVAQAGLPPQHTVLLNDVVAGALGVASILAAEGVGAASFAGLRDVAGEPAAKPGSLVYVAPGTGLGAATLVPRDGASSADSVILGCEAQHTAMPAFDDKVAPLIAALSAALGQPPTWEEFVSGRGIATAHALLEALEKGAAPDADSFDAALAPEVARAALGGDALALQAVRVYYRCAARFSQLLALSHLPCERVFLGGSSTARNRALLPGSGFEEAFDDNTVLRGTLETVGLCAVLDEDVNLLGAMGEAIRIASR